MTVTVELDDSALRVTCSGADTVWTMSRGIRVEIADITRAQVLLRSDAHKELGWRKFGSYIPGTVAAGWFAVRGRRGAGQWWAVFRDPEVLVVDTRLDKPARLVLQTAERYELAMAISARRPKS